MLAPSNELATLLFDALERAHRAAGREIWPTPQVRDFAGWQRDRYMQRQLIDGALPRCLTEIEERELWRDIVADGGSGSAELDPAVAARLARRARRTVIEYGIPWDAVAAQPSAETEVFLQWSRLYDERCRALDCVSGDDLTGRIEARPQRVFWIDSPAWRPVVRAWLERHGTCLAPAEIASGTSLRMHAGSPDSELAAAADWARSRLAQDGGFRAWLCMPDLNSRRSEIIDAFDAALAAHRFALRSEAGGAPYAVAGGTPLTEYACVRIALECLEAGTANMPFARFSALLRSPHLQADDAEESAAAVLDAALRERAPSEAGMRLWLDLATAIARELNLTAAPVQRLRAVGTALGAARGARRFSEWLGVWTQALRLGPWALQARWSSVEFQAVERLRELLASLAASDGFFGLHSRESALRILRTAARDTAFQPQTGVPPVWISSQITDPWLGFDGLWVSGMSADRWPAPVEPVALLPVQLQRSHGVVAANVETQRSCAQDLFARWTKRATECVFSHADAVDGRTSVLSPLLPADSAPLYEPGRAPQPRPHWQSQRRDAPPLERFWDELAPPFEPPERTRGVASLRAQSLCAFRGFAQTRLSADPLEQPTPGFNERERGQLVHDALEYIWSVLRDSNALHALLPAAQQELLDEGARRALEAVCERRDPGLTWRRREAVRLRTVLARWLDAERRRQPFVIEWLERQPQTVRFAGLEFRLRIDRSDRILQGGRVLIDYKTGGAMPDWRGDRPDNPQLPIYALLAPESLVAVAYGRVNAAEPGFVFESERPDIFRVGARATSLEGAATLAELLQIWSARIETLAAEFAGGFAAVAPKATACRFCQLQGLCRVPSMLDDEDQP